jgi:hypothetical protein
MPTFYIQFQPDLVAKNQEQQVLAAFRDRLPKAQFVEGNDDGRYVNITFKAAPKTGWALVSGVLALPRVGRPAQRGCIVVCEGKHGWDDYLLLHHPDRTQILDTISAPRAAE